MENWNPSVVYSMAIERHRENLGRGEAAQRMGDQQLGPPTRSRLAAALLTLAAWLDPALAVARPAIERGVA